MNDQEKYIAWLADLKIGDEVVVGSGNNNRSIGKIDRMTATQIVVTRHTYEYRYRRRDGVIVGNGYGHLAPVTAAVRQAVADRELKSWFRNLNYGWDVQVPIPVLQAMKIAYDKAMAELPKT